MSVTKKSEGAENTVSKDNNIFAISIF